MEQIKILFADDERQYARVIPSSCRPRKISYEFDFVHTIEDAIDHLEYNSFDYDLIIVDLKFKKEDLAGLKIFRYLSEKFLEIPSIIITAYANQKNLKECIEQRPYKLLEKPFDFATLKRTIQEVLKKASKKEKKPHLARTRKLLRQTTGRNKLNLIFESLESLSPEEYESVVAELPMIQEVIKEEERYKQMTKIDEDWKKTGKIPWQILEKANVSIECKVRKLASGDMATYGPFVYIRWPQDYGKQGQYYAGKLDRLTNPELIEKLYEKYQKDSATRELDKLNSIPILYKRYCQKSE